MQNLHHLHPVLRLYRNINGLRHGNCFALNRAVEAEVDFVVTEVHCFFDVLEGLEQLEVDTEVRKGGGHGLLLVRISLR